MANTKPPTAPISDPNTLQMWRERMGFTTEDACIALGCELANWVKWELDSRPVPRYIGLACAALALGMDPYGDDEKGM